MAQTVLVREMFEGLGTLNAASPGSFSGFVSGSLVKAAIGPRTSAIAAPGWSAAVPRVAEIKAFFDLTAAPGNGAQNFGMLGGWFRFAHFGTATAANHCAMLLTTWGVTWVANTGVGVRADGTMCSAIAGGSGALILGPQLTLNTWYFLAVAWQYNTGSTLLNYRTYYKPLGGTLTLATTTPDFYAGAVAERQPKQAMLVALGNGGTYYWKGRAGSVGLYAIGNYSDVAVDPAIIDPVEASNSWYINPSTGDDANTGTSPAAAWKTATKLQTALSNGVILPHSGYVNGDVLTIDTGQASLDLAVPLKFDVQGLNVRAAPGQSWIIVKPYKVLAPGGWAVVGGGVYSTTDTVALCCLWEDDKWLNHPNGASYAAVSAALAATPGSFWTDGTTLYLHPFGNTDPRSDGKTYIRSHVGLTSPAVQLDAFDLNLANIYVQKTCDVAPANGLPNAGYCIGSNVGCGGVSVIKDCYGDYGGKHILGLVNNAVNSDITIENFRGEQGSPYAGGGGQTPLVSYQDTGTGNIHRYIRCRVDKGVGVIGSSAGGNFVGPVFLSHGSSINNFAEIQFIDCLFKRGLVFDYGIAQLLTITGGTIGGCETSGPRLNINRCKVDWKGVNILSSSAILTVRNCLFVPTENLQAGQWTGCLLRNIVEMQNNVFDLSNVASSDVANRGFLDRQAALNLTFRNNVVIIPAGKNYTILENGVNTDALFFTNNAYILGSALLVAHNYNDGAATANRTLAQWQALGKDAESFNATDLEIDNNYLPLRTSPLIDAGVDLGPREDYSGIVFEVRDDIGIYEMIPTLADLLTIGDTVRSVLILAPPPQNRGFESALNLQFCPDLSETFFNIEEFGMTREFLIVEDGAERIVTTKCVWDTETLKTYLSQFGVYRGSVRCFIHKNIFRTEPRPEEIIYSPCRPYRIGWRVVDVTDAMECYELDLDKLIA